MWKTLATAALGLLLFAGSSSAVTRFTVSPGTNREMQRDHRATARQSFNRESTQEAVHLNGVLKASSHGRQVEIAGQKVIVGPQCGFFPNANPGRLPDLGRWSGREVTVFGFRSHSGVDARLIILNDAASNKYPRASSESLRTIASTSDPTVGTTRRDTPQ